MKISKFPFYVDLSFQLVPPIAIKMNTMQGSVVAYVSWFPYNGKFYGEESIHLFSGNHHFVLERSMLHLM